MWLIGASVASIALYMSLAQQLQIAPMPQRREFDIYIPWRGAEGNVTSILYCSLPEVPREMSSLRIVENYVTEAEGLAIAREVFGMTGDLEISRGSEPYSEMGFAVVGDGILTFWYSGVIEYSGGSEISAGLLPSFSEAKEIADAFLKRLGDYGLLPKSSQVQIEFSEMDYSAYYGTENEEPRPVLISVYYRVKYLGRPLVGSAGINMEVGGDGKIVSFSGKWWNVEPYRSVEITVSPEEALEKLGANMPVLRDEIESVYVNRFELGYFFLPCVEEQEEIMPVYVFDTLINGDRYLIYVPATST